MVVEEKKRERMRTIPENDKDISALYHTYPGRLLPEHLNPYKVIRTVTSPQPSKWSLKLLFYEFNIVWSAYTKFGRATPRPLRCVSKKCTVWRHKFRTTEICTTSSHSRDQLLFKVSQCTLKVFARIFQPNKKLMRKIPAGSECANILVGQVDFLDEPIVAFARLAKPAILADLTEVRLTRIHAHHTSTHAHIHTYTTYCLIKEMRLTRIHAHHTYTHAHYILEHIILNISTNSGSFYMKLSQWGSFLWDNQNKGSQPYVLTIITHNPKYLDQFLIVLLETFTTGLVVARQSKQGVTTLCFKHNYT